MRKLTFIIACFSLALLTENKAVAQGLNYAGHKVEFTYPKGVATNQTITFPTFEKQSPGNYEGDTVTIEVNHFYTYVLVDTITANTVVSAEISAYVTAGAMLWVNVYAPAAPKNLTFLDNFSAPVLTGDTSTTKVRSFIYDGTNFVATGTQTY